MGLVGALIGVVSSAISVVSSAISTIGGTLAKYASNLLTVAGKWLPVVADIVCNVANVLGVTDTKEDPTELGYAALNSDKKLEDFDSSKEYIEYIKNSIEIDKEKFKNLNEAEKIACTSIGSSILIDSIAENKGLDEISPNFFVSLAKLGLDKIGGVDGANYILDTFKDGKLDDFAKYVFGDLDSVKDKIFISDRLVSMYEKLYPDMDIKDIQSIVTNMSNVE
ncbi:hypothetical protein [Campylobacter ureolyticus]|uniref:hypothetical protein n=1 Tax=Campylobacter ureolyticus TaxID=827 RepID=UPI0026EFF827|nr:hypothetical protein [Campylobacter ureolyticus]